MGFDFFGGGLGIWVVGADGMAVDEVYERTDAYPGATENDNHVWFIGLDGR